jgi:hypothetical protein
MRQFVGSVQCGAQGYGVPWTDPAPVTPVVVGSLAETCGDGCCVWVVRRNPLTGEAVHALKYRWARCREWGHVPVVRPAG